MKRYLTIFVLLCTISTVHGAHFSYYGGGLRAFYDVYAENPPSTDGRSGYQDGTNFASKAGSASVFQANSYASSNIASKSLGNSIRIKSESTANGYGAMELPVPVMHAARLPAALKSPKLRVYSI